MISQYRTLLRDKDSLYEVIDSCSTESLYDEERLFRQELFDAHMRRYGADTVLRNGPMTFFCKRIEEIEFETINTDVVLQSES